ncbi:MAG: serine hydrolase domain-containing protein [Acidobacteriota bacterium]
MKLKKMLFYIILILSVTVISCTKTNDLASKLNEYMAQAEKAGFSGSVLTAKENKILLSSGYGMANREKEIPFTADTVSTIGSITKQFTAAGILKLQMMGEINVNDSIAEYFHGVPDDKKEITLHHLLTHMAGFPGAIGPDFDPISRDEFIKLAMKTELKRRPGTLYEYSNVGYSLLGIIIELVSGKSYEEFLNENLFSPVGMPATGYLIPDWNKENLAHGYRGTKEWGTLLNYPWLEDGPGWHLRGNGGLPDSITGRCSAALLNAISSQDLEKAEQFIKYYLASNFLEEFTLEEHLHQFQKMQKDMGEIELLEAVKRDDYSVRLKVRSKLKEKIYQISLELQSEPPHKIIGIGVERGTFPKGTPFMARSRSETCEVAISPGANYQLSRI